MLIQFLISLLPLFLIARAILLQVVPEPPEPVEGASKMDSTPEEDLPPFRLMDLPIELILRTVHLLDEATTKPPPLPSKGAPARRVASCGRRSRLAALSLTCRSMYRICRPLLHRWLVLETLDIRSDWHYDHLVTRKGQLDRLPPALSHLLEVTDRLGDSWPGAPFLRSFWYTGFRGAYGRHRDGIVDRLEALSGITSSLERAVSKFESLTFLELDCVSDATAAACLGAANQTLQAVSLSYIAPSAFLDSGQGLAIPSLPGLRGIKIFECPHVWLRIVTPTTDLRHLAVWQPTLGFRDMDWLTMRQMETIITLNLDGFRQQPRHLVALCRMIMSHAADNRNGPLPLRDLDIEARFSLGGSSSSLFVLLDALTLMPSLEWLALSVIPKHSMSPAVLEAIGQALGDRLRFLLVMVETYRKKSWPGDLAKYAYALRHFKRLHTFAVNHAFARPDSDPPAHIAHFIPPLQAMLPELGFDDMDELLDELDSDDDVPPDDQDGLLRIRPHRLTDAQRRIVRQAGVFFGADAPCRSLRRLIQVTALFANSAKGSMVTRRRRAEEEREEPQRKDEDLKLAFKGPVDLERLLLPFVYRWADI